MIEDKNLSRSATRVFNIFQKLSLSDCLKTELLGEFSDDSLSLYLNTLNKIGIKIKKKSAPDKRYTIINNINFFDLKHLMPHKIF